MNVTNNTNDYDNITSSNYTDILNEYDNVISTNYPDTNNCTNNIDTITPSLLIIPCGSSFLCLMSLMVYTIIILLIKNK